MKHLKLLSLLLFVVFLGACSDSSSSSPDLASKIVGTYEINTVTIGNVLTPGFTGSIVITRTSSTEVGIAVNLGGTAGQVTKFTVSDGGSGAVSIKADPNSIDPTATGTVNGNKLTLTGKGLGDYSYTATKK